MAIRDSLSVLFRGAGGGAGGTEDAVLEVALLQYVAAARAPWPEWELDERDFVRHVGARCRDGKLQPLAHASDLYLAYACSRRLSAALSAFHQRHGRVIERMLAYRKADADLAADARQIVHERLLVGRCESAEPPGIATYRGTGPLSSWVASSAATTLAMLRRSARRRREQSEGWDQLNLERVQLDPELDYLKTRYKAAVEHAFVEALAQLGERDRALLRLHFAERLSIDAVALLFATSRASAARWLARARRSLLDTVKRTLQAGLHLSDTECNSVVALVRSQLELSMLRLLGSG